MALPGKDDGADREQPLCILIAALGGEGGGVLADWIVDSALAAGLPVQATSVPGVAQRTGATSYYIELMRAPAPADQRPVFSLSPMPGRVDIVVASELLEAARMIERGFVSPERSTLIAARHRVYTTLEKMQMGDGRFDDTRIHEAALRFSKRYLSLDMEALAARHGTVISAVMFGALAGSGALPWSREASEAAIRRAGIGVEASLAGFGAAFELAATASISAVLGASPSGRNARPEAWASLIASLPTALHDNAAHGVVRLIDWQDEAWAREYLGRLQSLSKLAGGDAAQRGMHPLADAESRPDAETASAAQAAQPELLPEAARQLALWMSYEDVIRVADLKTRPARFERIRTEADVGDGQLLHVVDYLKPGWEEIAAILPRAIGGRLRARARRKGYRSLPGAGLHVSPSTISGYLMLRLLARLRPLRRRSLRLHEEQQAIEEWLAALARALPVSPGLAEQIAALPRLLKGYGETWERGAANYRRIFDTLVMPALETLGQAEEDGRRAALIRDAIRAALADPEGRGLEQSLARAGFEPLPPKPKPIVWMRKPRGKDPEKQIGENRDSASRATAEPTPPS